MKILVTGAAGFVGSHLCEKLVSMGHDVIGIDCFTDFYDRALKEQNARDVRDVGVLGIDLDLSIDEIAPTIEGVEVIYHLAAQPGISAHVPLETYMRHNITATHRLLEAAKNLPTLRCFINTATSSIYGKRATDTEDMPPQPISYYGVTKLAAEQLALSYYREHEMPVCSLRLFSVYGPRERPEKLYPKLIGALLHEESFPLCEGSEFHKRSYTYIDDAILGFTSVLDKLTQVKGEIFNIGSDQCITTGEAIRIVENIMNKKARFVTAPKRPGDQLYTHANIDKARRVLGYEPTTLPKEGLAKEVEWYLQMQNSEFRIQN